MKTRILFTLLLVGNALMAQTFTEVPDTPFEGVADGSIAFADVDGDNDPDILITGRTISGDPISKLYLNTDGIYAEDPNNSFAPVANSAIAFADVDGDNDPDVIITGMSISGPTSKLYINDAGTFTESTANQFTGVSFGMVAFADIDGDTDMDLFITGKETDATLVSNLYLNDNGIFTATPTVINSSYDGSANFADMDGDGDLDFIISGSAGGFNIYRNNDGIFISNSFEFYNPYPLSNTSLSVADIDGDDDIDMVFSGLYDSEGGNYYYEPITKVFKNEGYTFEWNTSLMGVYGGSLTFTDVDADGDPDLFVSGFNSYWNFFSHFIIPEFILYLNDGNGNFSELDNTPFPGIGQSSVAVADIDNDGDPDVLIAGNTASQDEEDHYITKIYLNNSSPTNVAEIDTSLYGFTVFPNPTTGLIRFSEYADIQVKNITGQVIAVRKNSNILDLSGQPSGVYFITLSDPKGRVLQQSKVVKQ